MLVVTGASGKLGGLVLEALLRLVPAEQIGVSVREPEKLSHLAALGVRVSARFKSPSKITICCEPSNHGADTCNIGPSR